MAEDTEEAESEVAGCLALLDVVQIPSVGALVYNHLGPEGCKQARLVCRALCMLVRKWKLLVAETPVNTLKC
jgi:hypothetical protein